MADINAFENHKHNLSSPPLFTFVSITLSALKFKIIISTMNGESNDDIILPKVIQKTNWSKYDNINLKYWNTNSIRNKLQYVPR